MMRQWSVQSGQALMEPEPEPGVEELWEQEMERLWSSQAQVRELPYAMVDKRFIRQLREPKGVKTSCWRRCQRRWRTVRRRLGEAAQRLARGFGLWEGALYEIGGLFGTGIQSYFTFLRFLLLLNLLILLLTASFVLLPLVWLRPPDAGPSLNFTLACPGGLQPQTGVPRFHNRLWNVLTGRAFADSYLFYGAYRAGPEGSSAYSIRLAYLLSPLACLLLCFCGILQRMVKGLPQRLFLGQDYKSPVSVKVFSSWDFCTRGQEAATIKKHEISNEFKVELEERRRFLLVQQETRAQKACHLLTHLRVNVLIGLLVVGAISAIFWATKYSQDNKEESLFVVLQYLPPGVIALVNFLGPLLFVSLIQLENYPPNTEVNLTLVWCVVLKLASLGMFSFSLGQTVLCFGRNKTSCASYGYNACDYQCWENAVGEELYKLSIFNFLLMVAFAFFVSLPRRLLVERFSGRFWTWLDREEFLVPKNVLDIVAGQTITWMGLFYCPLLPLLNSVFIFLTFYIKKVSDTGWGGGVEPLSAGRGSGPASARPLGVPSPGLGLLGVCDWLRTPICCCLPPVHPHEELQGLSKAVPRLQLHLLLPAGAPPGPAPGRRAPGLCGQQHPLLLGLWPLRQLLGPLAGGPTAGGPPAAAPCPARPPLPRLPRLQLPLPHPTQPCPDRLRLPVPGQRQGHPGAPQAAGVASPGEVAPGGGPVATAARDGLWRLCGARIPSLPSFPPAVFLPWIPVPRLPGPQGP
ncbi:transmembrane channel-like protein 8 isoform X2 [Mustela putorius furo]|uniref:Transmembrane channel-like protein n=1 Tax=Mustela putorius furo TaxID=9669 RepID=A0A8U0NT23_MUSPF|nr:transmembrane channel-like protein 8 isoform X2 [Mustela putorius furo]